MCRQNTPSRAYLLDIMLFYNHFTSCYLLRMFEVLNLILIYCKLMRQCKALFEGHTWNDCACCVAACAEGAAAVYNVLYTRTV